jgi:chaperone required for assembly of F1-ATPase
MKRFWKEAAAAPSGSGWQVLLDARPLRTPARALLEVDGEPLAQAIAAEWALAEDKVNPRAMPLTGLANAAIDRVAPDPASFAASLSRFAASDLLTYRADGPRPLVERENNAWDPLLDWARARFGVEFVVTTGITPVDQPRATLETFDRTVAALDAFSLAGLAPLVTVGGSLVAGLAVLERAVDVNTGWAAVSLDEAYQLDTWGEDAEARRALESREADFRAGARFLALLRA